MGKRFLSIALILSLVLSMVLALVPGLVQIAHADNYVAQKASSIAAGDLIVFVCEDAGKELASISETSTKYGIGAEYALAPAGTMAFTVEAGSAANTFAFKNGSNYLYWGSGNSLSTSATLDANSSWTVSFDEANNAAIVNAGDSDRQIWWNVSSPRFACYTGKSAGSSYFNVQLYKLTEDTSSTHDIVASSDPAAGGTVSSSDTLTGLAEDATATLTAAPNEGYLFSHWTVSGAKNNDEVNNSTNPSITITMGSANIAATAVFNKITGTFYKAEGTIPAEATKVVIFYTPESKAVGTSLFKGYFYEISPVDATATDGTIVNPSESAVWEIESGETYAFKTADGDYMTSYINNEHYNVSVGESGTYEYDHNWTISLENGTLKSGKDVYMGWNSTYGCFYGYNEAQAGFEIYTDVAPAPTETSLFEGEDWADGWTAAVPGDNAEYQNNNSKPSAEAAEKDKLLFDYKYFIKEGKLYVGAKFNQPLTKGTGNGNSSFFRIWLKSNPEASAYTHFFDCYVKEDGTIGTRAAVNSVLNDNKPTNNESTQYTCNMQEFEGHVEAVMCIPLDEVGATDYLRMFVNCAIEKSTGGATGNQCLLAPGLADAPDAPIHVTNGWSDANGNIGIKLIDSVLYTDAFDGVEPIQVTAENARWQSPKDQALLTYTLELADDGEFLYVRVIGDAKFADEIDTFRFWIRSNDEATVYTHFYDVDIAADGKVTNKAKFNQSTTTNSGANIENSAMEFAAKATADEKTMIVFKVPLAEFGGEQGFAYYAALKYKGVDYSYYPAPEGTGTPTMPYNTWDVEHEGLYNKEHPITENVFDLGEIKPINGITFTADNPEGLANVKISISADGKDFFDMNNGNAVAVSGGKASPNFSSRGVFNAQYIKVVGEPDVHGSIAVVEGDPAKAVNPEGPYTNTGLNEQGYGIVVIYEGTVDTNQGKGTELNIAGAQLVIAQKVDSGVYKMLVSSVNAWPDGGHADITSEIDGISIADGVITLAEDQIAVVIMSSGAYTTAGDGEFSNAKHIARGLGKNGYIRIDGDKLTMHSVQPDPVEEPSPEPAGAYAIKTFAGYASGDVALFLRQGDKITLSAINGNNKDYNAYALIIVGADGIVSELDLRFGRPDGKKDTVEVPEGGFIIGINADVTGYPIVHHYDSATDTHEFEPVGVKVGDGIKLYGIDLEATAAAANGGDDLANVTFDVISLEEVPEGALAIDYAQGWKADICAIYTRLATGEKTFGEVTGVTTGKVQDSTWWNAILVDANGKVIERIGMVNKTDVEIPEGGYMMAAHGASPALNVFASIELGSTITLYNCDLEAFANLTEGEALLKAAFTVTEPVVERPISYQKSYTYPINSRSDKWAEDGTKLTDGKMSDDGGNAGFSGWGNRTVDGEVIPTNVEIVVDLEGEYYVNLFDVHAAANTGWGIQMITGFTVSYSLDGETFTAIEAASVKGEDVATGEWTAALFTIELETAVKARYVKFATIKNAQFTWIDEVEVWEGEEPTPEPQPSDPETYLWLHSDTFGSTPGIHFKVPGSALKGGEVTISALIYFEDDCANNGGSVYVNCYSFESEDFQDWSTLITFVDFAKDSDYEHGKWVKAEYTLDPGKGTYGSYYGQTVTPTMLTLGIGFWQAKGTIRVAELNVLQGEEVLYHLDFENGFDPDNADDVAKVADKGLIGITNDARKVAWGVYPEDEKAAELNENLFWLTHYDDASPEGAGVIFTTDFGAAYWGVYAFAPIAGVENGYELVAAAPSSSTATTVACPEGGFLYAINLGNNWPALMVGKTGDGKSGAWYDDLEHLAMPNYVSPAVSAMWEKVAGWKVGDQFIITGVDLENKTIPTSTPDKEWYQVSYVCTATIEAYVAPEPEAYEVTINVKDHAILTDGQTGFNGGWGDVGTGKVVLVTNAECKTKPMHAIIIDELDEAKKVSGITLDLYHCSNVMIGYPEGKAIVSVSLDGETYTKVGEFDLAEAELSLSVSGTVSNAFTFDAVDAKFVKVELDAGSNKEVLGDSPADGKIYWEFISIAEVSVAVEEELPVQPDELEQLPEGALLIDFAGYKHAFVNSIVAGDNQTVAELTARGNGGVSKDMNYAYNILVDKDNKVIAVDFKLSQACDFICPEGGYIISFNGNKAGYTDLAAIEVGATITLYNILLDGVRAVEGNKELTQAGFTYENPSEPEPISEILVSHHNFYNWATFDVMLVTKNTVKEVPNVSAGVDESTYVMYVVENKGGHFVVTKFVADAEMNTTECPEGGFLLFAHQSNRSYNGIKNGELLGKELILEDFTLEETFALDTVKDPDNVKHITVQDYEEPTFIPGDLNGDGELDAADYFKLKKSILGSIELTDEERARADVNGDGEIDALDYIMLKKKVLSGN